MGSVIATLFDFDGVLVDSEPVHLAAFNDVLEKYGVKIGEKEYAEKYLSLDDAGVFRSVLARGGHTLREEHVRALVSAKNPRFMARFAGSFRVFPGAAELVRRRSERGPIAIVSGALEAEIVYALEKMGVRSLMAFIVSAEHTKASKPDPAPFFLAAEKLRDSGHTTGAVVVEDSTGGVVAAQKAGLRCVAVAHSYTREELLRAGADAAVDDLASITDALLEGM